MKHSAANDGGSGVEHRLAALCDRYGLGKHCRAALEAILGVLAADERAPTTVRDPASALDVHLADSLAALDVAEIRSARAIADVGAGAGFPGLPLALALPEATVRLVESQSRKCEFLRDLSAAAGAVNVEVVDSRVEDWSAGAGAQDVVLARALAAPAIVLEYAAPLLRLDGALIDWRGRHNAEEEQAGLRAAEILGMERVEVRRVEPYAGALEHHLHLYRKRAETPERFPRRAGMARKRPLGA